MKKEYVLRFVTDNGEGFEIVNAETDNEAVSRAKNMIRVKRNQGVATFEKWKLDKVITETFYIEEKY